MENTDLKDRQSFLLAVNETLLLQALEVLERVEDAAYTQAPAGLGRQRAGSHLRHVIEFYECFLEGLHSCHVDYDARKRDESIELSREVASRRIRAIIRALRSRTDLRSDGLVWVRAEDSADLRDRFLTSSIGRELQVLASHTTHHYALIAIILRLHGEQVDANFGVAASTLRAVAEAA